MLMLALLQSVLHTQKAYTFAERLGSFTCLSGAMVKEALFIDSSESLSCLVVGSNHNFCQHQELNPGCLHG